MYVNQYSKSRQRFFCFKPTSLIYKGGKRIGQVKRSVQVRGSFNQGQLEGECQVVVEDVQMEKNKEDKKLSSKVYKTLY